MVTDAVGGTTITWTGGASDMLRWGNQADHIVGGGIKGIEFDGGLLATRAIHVTDAQKFNFENLLLKRVITEALTFDNNSAAANPTGRASVKNLRIHLRDGSALDDNAIGIGLRGTLPTSVFRITFDNVAIDHANGNGVTVVLGDGCTWIDLHIFRSGSETGIGFDVRPVNASDPVSGHVLINAIIAGGIRIETTGAAALDSTQQLTVLHYGTLDSGSITGAGASINTLVLQDNGQWTGRSQDFTGGIVVSGASNLVRSGSGQANFTGSGLTQFTGADINIQNGVALIGYSDAASTETLRLNMSTGAGTFGAAVEIDGDLNHDGSNVGFYGTAPVAQQTGVAVTAAGIHAALVNLGLITA